MKEIYDFSEEPAAPLALVGGKAFSLVRMSQAGLRVPPGIVLATPFFAAWLGALRQTPEWGDMMRQTAADFETLTAVCRSLKARAAALTFSVAQKEALTAALASFPLGCLFAVRSSSPEEDLAGASFAGGYETVLGVALAGLEPAVRRAFSSCLDARVAVYKREHGFDPANPRIAVVIQRQIASDVAGVGLSLNPITNAYDEAVFNANWGLGESVVSGLASPDLYVVDKVGRRLQSRQLGKKETSFWLSPAGGTEERPDPRHDEWALRDGQVLELSDQLAKIEAFFGQPMDIEWAFADGQCYLLQARPMTAYLPLPPDFVTRPGEPKRLYFDVTLVVQGFTKPMSAMGTSALAALVRCVSLYFGGRDLSQDPEVAFGVARHGKILLNLGWVLGLLGTARLRAVLAVIDPSTALALTTVDVAAYRRRTRPSLRALGRFCRIGARGVIAVLRPVAYRRQVDAFVAQYFAALTGMVDPYETAAELADSLASQTFHRIVYYLIPAVAAWKFAMARLRRLFPQATAEQLILLSKLDQSLPGNVTVAMGLQLAQLALAGLPREAVLRSEGWRTFLLRFGHRGPGELDVAEPRYREKPNVLMDQLALLAGSAVAPAALFELRQRERLAAIETLACALRLRSRRKERRFRKWCLVVESLGGLRETPKYLLIKAFDSLRTRILQDGAKLVAAGRLDKLTDVFDLTLEDLAAGTGAEALDLRVRRGERRRPIDLLAKARVTPSLFDSRGRMFRPPPMRLKPDELSGQPVSVGVARGPVKVLRTPDEKPLLPGEILVARATDPGWTPLFVNAAAIILEIGGAMQHGALVAREYGKPCVTGVEDATGRLRDGEWIEVDGASGTIRRCAAPEEVRF